VRADNLARALGMTGTLWVKDDSGNPTHSFKDRVVAVAQSAARRLGLGTIACASTGNLANAVAAAAARAGQKSVVVIPSDLEDGKVVTTATYGGTLLAVEGNYDDVNRLCSELIGDPLTADWGFVNVNLRPYYAEGSKTLGYEIAEQLGWSLPDQVVCPIASGSLFTKIAKGFAQWLELGLVEGDLPAFNGAQAAGCSPVASKGSRRSCQCSGPDSRTRSPTPSCRCCRTRRATRPARCSTSRAAAETSRLDNRRHPRRGGRPQPRAPTWPARGSTCLAGPADAW